MDDKWKQYSWETQKPVYFNLFRINLKDGKQMFSIFRLHRMTECLLWRLYFHFRFIFKFCLVIWWMIFCARIDAWKIKSVIDFHFETNQLSAQTFFFFLLQKSLLTLGVENWLTNELLKTNRPTNQREGRTQKIMSFIDFR